MYANVAYVDRVWDEIIDLTVPLLVTSCGYYRVHTFRSFQTERSSGRQDYQLLYVASGKAHYRINGTDYHLSKGNMVLYRPGQAQYYYYFSEDKPEIYWVHFTGSQVAEFLNSLDFPHDDNIFFCGTSPDYAWLFDQMIRELQLRRTGYEELLPLLLRHILILMHRFSLESRSFGADTLNEIEQATRYFQEHYHEPICIETYAHDHNMSASWFNRSFKNLVNVTPMQYILSLRMTNAKNLLDSTGYNISEVARAVGYDNPLYFSRLFHKHIGLSPSEYRQKNTTRNISYESTKAEKSH